MGNRLNGFKENHKYDLRKSEQKKYCDMSISSVDKYAKEKTTLRLQGSKVQ